MLSSRSIKQNQRQIHHLQHIRIHDDDSTMCRFYCIAFIEYLFAGKTLLDYTNSFSPNDYKKNDNIIYK